MFFKIVPTFYVVYKVTDDQTGSLLKLKEFISKGAAVNWISKQGEKGTSYSIRATYRR